MTENDGNTWPFASPSVAQRLLARTAVTSYLRGGHFGPDFGFGHGPGASRERKGRHRVHYGIYQLRSTWATPIRARNGSKTCLRRDIGLRLAPASEKCPQTDPKGVQK